MCMAKEYKVVAEVRQIFLYPVKSMRGQSVSEARLGWHGLAGDRRFAFTRVGNPSGLPWLSAREIPTLLLYEAAFIDLAVPDRSSILVTTPRGQSLAVDSPELLRELEDLYEGKLLLTRLWRGTFDSMDISMISNNAVESVARLVGQDLSAERFRPNLVVQAVESKPYPEDRWLGELLVFGDRPDSARIRINRKDLRCTIVNFDPRTAEPGPDVLGKIVQSRRNLVGVYGTTERPGTIKVNDLVYLRQG
jgi:uncharacterized protein YcbX